MSANAAQPTSHPSRASQSHALVGRTALVTGASRGIGLATATALAAAGARVHLIARTPGDLQSAARAIGTDAVAHVCDVTSPAEVAAVVTAIAAQGDGAPDVLVNNAGLFPLGALDRMDVAEFERAVQANLIAPFRLLRAFLPAMRERGSGHIITLGSIADRTAFPGNGAYSASKYGQRGMHEVLRAELRGTGVRTTLISPAATDTPIWDPVDPDNSPGFAKRAEMLRATDVAEAVLWAATRPATVNIDELRLSAS
ncbi:MAG TPA: SDR family oxidoreductase [Gemmatimonas sp.]|nr:SDR family oxidoreductase [Gemmatimonas sp.]